jgi:hypothetical protein
MEFGAAKLGFSGNKRMGNQRAQESLDFCAKGAVGKAGLWRGGDLGQDAVTKKVDLQADWARKVGFGDNVGAETGLIRGSEE